MNSTETSIQIVQIRDEDPQGHLAADLSDVLGALGLRVRELDWIITELDCSGEEAQALADEVEASRARGDVGVRVSGEKLLAVLAPAGQTFDGALVGFAPEITDVAQLRDVVDARAMPRTAASVMVNVVDSTFAEILTKDPRDIDRLRETFSQIEHQSPLDYFERAR